MTSSSLNLGRFSAALFFLPLLLLSCADDPRREDPSLEQFAVSLVELTGLDHEMVAVNPAEVVSLHSPRKRGHVLTPRAACAVQMTNGKHVAVLETCPVVRQRLDAAK